MTTTMTSIMRTPVTSDKMEIEVSSLALVPPPAPKLNPTPIHAAVSPLPINFIMRLPAASTPTATPPPKVRTFSISSSQGSPVLTGAPLSSAIFSALNNKK